MPAGVAAAGAEKEFSRWSEDEAAEVRKGQVTLALEGGPWSLREALEPRVPVNKESPAAEGAGAGCKHAGASCVWSLAQAAGICCGDYWSKASRSRMRGAAERKMAWARWRERLLLSCLRFS